MRKVFLILVFVGLSYWGYSSYQKYQALPRVAINDRTYFVEVADTPESRMTGLMNRDNLGGADGMLFIFDTLTPHSFWMKDVRFPLDIVWINEDRVVYIVESAEPSPAPPHKNYTPTESANFVLELPSGTVLRDGIQIGAKVEIKI